MLNLDDATALEQVPCDLCGCDFPVSVFRRPDSMNVVECAECGLMYLNPRPAPGTIEAWYGRDYFSGAASQGGRGYSSYLAENTVPDLRREAEQKLALIEHHVNLKGADVLELGCATGEASYLAWRKGAKVTGCDLSAEAIQAAKNRYPQIEFCSSPVDRLPFDGPRFDIIIAFELIEHLVKPSDFVIQVGRLLRPGGILALTTPNADRGRRVGWAHWSGFSTSFEHLYFFNSRTLTRLLSRQGMSVVGAYSQGDGKIRKPNSRRLKNLLRSTGLFVPAKALYRALLPSPPTFWAGSQDLHTLMLLARKS